MNTEETITELFKEIAELRVSLENARMVYLRMRRYCKNNTLNFQMEKLNDFIHELGEILNQDK